MRAATLRLRAYAKINLTLEVVGQRPDGYHDLISVMQTVALADEVELLPGTTGLTVIADAAWAVPSGADNFVTHALEHFRESSGNSGFRAAVRLTKRIPPTAGLGGGSSDAAATLRGLASLAPFPVAERTLADLAAALGSDVPFFLRGGTQLAEGRGERLTQVPDISER
ncbi:MAG: 4-(cytidine 5'-diphospho)-2-C-methyl-D-erythritol kinase, partial [Dehalococcoidia bacterium]